MENSCGNCKYAFEVPDGEHCGSCSRGYVDQFTPMTNADKIRRMADEELADFLREVVNETGNNMFLCDDFIKKEVCKSKPCTECLVYLEWLQSPAEEGDEK